MYINVFGKIAELPEEVRERWDNFVAGALSDVNKRNTVESVRKQKVKVTKCHLITIRSYVIQKQGCHIPYWYRAQGPSKQGKLSTF